MEPGRRWCDRKACPDYGIAGAGNIKVFSYVEQRYYCATCRHTFSADKHTFFETLRSARDGTRSVGAPERARQPEGGGPSYWPPSEPRAALARIGRTA